MKIIGITGTIGAGKGTIVDYLTTHHGFVHFAVRGYLTDIIHSRGLPLNRDSMVAVANDLREKHSPSFIAEELYKKAHQGGKDCIIESLRTVGEIRALQAKGNFHLFAVDADQQLRYQRVVERASETDKISFETFVQNENREMESDDPHKQNLTACMRLADFTFLNNGSFEELYRHVDQILNQL